MGRSYYKWEDNKLWWCDYAQFRGKVYLPKDWETSSYKKYTFRQFTDSIIARAKREEVVRGGLVFFSEELQVPPRRTKTIPLFSDESPLK